MSNCRFNLLTNEAVRAALADEAKPRRPKVARIIAPSLGAGARERLEGTGAGPDGSGVRPSSESKSERPAPDAGEEVTLDKSIEVSGLNIDNASFVHFAIRNQSFLDQFAQPRRRERVDLVVIR
jgi:hypothetical protein